MTVVILIGLYLLCCRKQQQDPQRQSNPIFIPQTGHVNAATSLRVENTPRRKKCKKTWHSSAVRYGAINK